MTYWIIASLILIMVIGFISMRIELKSLIRRRVFAEHFRNKYVELTNIRFPNTYRSEGEIDNELYNWLMHNVDKMQEQMGSIGIVSYVAPGGKFSSQNYQMLVNTIPNFRTPWLKIQEAQVPDDLLQRYIGSVELMEETIINQISNPFIWFREGFKKLIGTPIYFLNWFGVISDRKTKRVENNIVWKIFSAIAAFVGFVAAIVSILKDFDVLKKMFH